MALLLKADGEISEVFPNENMFSLEELQKYVGGHIELVVINHKDKVEYMYINEEGKLNGLPFNLKATVIAHAHKSIFLNDCIVGDALICSDKETE